MKLNGWLTVLFPEETLNDVPQLRLLIIDDFQKFDTDVEKQRPLGFIVPALDVPDHTAFASDVAAKIQQVKLQLNGCKNFQIFFDDHAQAAQADVFSVGQNDVGQFRIVQLTQNNEARIVDAGETSAVQAFPCGHEEPP